MFQYALVKDCQIRCTTANIHNHHTCFQILLIGLLADLISFNRQIGEEVLFRIRRLEGERAAEASRATTTDGAASRESAAT